MDEIRMQIEQKTMTTNLDDYRSEQHIQHTILCVKEKKRQLIHFIAMDNFRLKTMRSEPKQDRHITTRTICFCFVVVVDMIFFLVSYSCAAKQSRTG